MKTVTFQNLGRHQACWSETIPDDSGDLEILRAIRKRKVLASKLIWLDRGDIWAGDRLVGSYKVE